MGRRNWQARQEEADAQRRTAKQRKQRSDDRRQHKAGVRDLLHLLERHGPYLRQQQQPRLRWHVWTDSIASDSPSLLDVLDGGADAVTGIFCSGGGGGKPAKGRGGGRGRSASMGSDDRAGLLHAKGHGDKLGGGGGWSGSVSESNTTKGNKKKAHPRSKEASSSSSSPSAAGMGEQCEERGAVVPLLLCRSHFFTGRCDEASASRSGSGSKKSGGGSSSSSSNNCRYLHYSSTSRYKTLAAALHVNRKKRGGSGGGGSGGGGAEGTPPPSDALLREIQFTEAAAAASIPDDIARTDPGAMEMVYYLEVELRNKDNDALTSTSPTPTTAEDEQQQEEEESQKQPQPQQSVVEELLEALSSRDIKPSSIVYVALNEALVFDRYREGVLLNDREFLFAAAYGGGAEGGAMVGGGDRRLSVESEGDLSLEVQEALNNLPGPILEHMLTFLPDSAVAAAARVCKAWHHEIGQNSPNLWRHLLLRHGWPLPEAPTGAAAVTAADVAAEEVPVDANETDPMVFRTAFLQHYAAMRDVNAIKSGVSALRTTNRTAAAAVEEKEMCYQDFSTRKNAPSAPNCCVAIQIWSPKRILAAYSRDCSLRLFESVSRGGNNEKLCRELVSVRVDPYKNTKRRSCALVSMGLDEEAIGCLCHVMADNVEAEAYILVVLSRDDFLLGGSADAGSDVNLNVIDIGEAVINFLLISDVVDHRTLQLIDFLSDGGAIGDVEVLVSQTIAACGYGRFMVEVSISIPSTDPNQTAIPFLLDRKLVLISASAGAIVWMGESNDLSRPLRPRREDMTLMYLRRPHPGGSRAACNVVVASISTPAILAGEIVPTGLVHNAHLVEASDLVRNEMSEEGWEVRSWRHLRPIVITESTIISVNAQVRLENNDVVARRSIVSFYPRYPAVNEPSYDTLMLQDLEALKVASLRDNHIVLLCRQHRRVQSRDEMTVFAVVVHVPSRTEIGRVSLFDGVNFDQSEIPEISVVNDETIGVGLSWRGVVMTGHAVRSVGKSEVIIFPRMSKKKKRTAKKGGGKKDAFARGMSLRG